MYCLYKSATIASQVALFFFLLSSNANMKRPGNTGCKAKKMLKVKMLLADEKVSISEIVESLSHVISRLIFSLFSLFYFGERKLGGTQQINIICEPRTTTLKKNLTLSSLVRKCSTPFCRFVYPFAIVTSIILCMKFKYTLKHCYTCAPLKMVLVLLTVLIPKTLVCSMWKYFKR